MGVSNFTVLAVGAVLLAGLAGHVLMRQNAQAEHRNRMATADMLRHRQDVYDNTPSARIKCTTLAIMRPVTMMRRPVTYLLTRRL